MIYVYYIYIVFLFLVAIPIALKHPLQKQSHMGSQLHDRWTHIYVRLLVIPLTQLCIQAVELNMKGIHQNVMNSMALVDGTSYLSKCKHRYISTNSSI